MGLEYEFRDGRGGEPLIPQCSCVMMEVQMLLPQAWIRRNRLQRALRDYPLYDPPHKAEERVLSREDARENFDYFMAVRIERLAYFRQWLRREFGVTITPDQKGMEVLTRWGNKYGGLLLVVGPDGHPTDTYFTYDPAWIGENAGHNVVFDMGIALGEFIIANCPQLRWAFDTESEVLPRTARMMQKEPGMSFRRPELIGTSDPTTVDSPLHEPYIFCTQMVRYTITFKGLSKMRSFPAPMKRDILDNFSNIFRSIVKAGPNPGRPEFAAGMSDEEYAGLIDNLNVEGDEE